VPVTVPGRSDYRGKLYGIEVKATSGIQKKTKRRLGGLV